MSLFPDLQRASFNGISFLIKKASTTGGRKIVTQEFVRSDIRFDEDLGLQNTIYHITGIISEPDYLTKRNNLLRELTLEGQGLLQHPLYGRRTVTALPFTVTEDLQKAGLAVIEMVFHEDDKQSQPLPNAFSSNALAERLAAELLALLRAELAEKYKVPRGADNFGDAIAQNINTGAFFGSATSAVGQTADNSEYTAALTNFNANVVDFVSDPESLATSVSDLVDKSQLLFDDSQDTFNFLKTGFEFNSVGVNLESDTPSNAERTTNRKAIVDMMRGMNLGAAYSQAAQIKFVLAEDLESTKLTLDSAFDDILNNDRMNNESVDKLEELREAAHTIFDDEEVNLFKIEIIQVQTQPVGIITFNHYGDTTLEEELISLNEVANPSFVNGDFKILTL